MSKPFVKGDSRAGRKKGSTNKEDLNSLRKLLGESFSENRIVIRNMLNAMYMDTKKHIDELNKLISQLPLDDKEYTFKLRDYSHARSSLLQEFKWLLELKASLEPKNLQVTDGEGLALKPPTIIFQSTVHNNGVENAEGRLSENRIT